MCNVKRLLDIIIIMCCYSDMFCLDFVCLWSDSVFNYSSYLCGIETFKFIVVERLCWDWNGEWNVALPDQILVSFVFRLWSGGRWRVLRGQCFSCPWQLQSLCSWVDSACFTPSNGFQVRKRVRVSNKMHNYNTLLILRSARVWIHYLYKQ